MDNKISIEKFKPQAVIIANGDYPTGSIPLNILSRAEYVVCCDGGANEYIRRGFTPNAIVGDGDSLHPDYREQYKEIIHRDKDQETNDQTKAIKFLIQKGISKIAIIGATGKREDHTLGNIALLIEYMRMGVEVRSYTDYGVFVPCKDSNSFESFKGEQISIFNVSAHGFNSSGLKYPIYDFTAWWQGTLNQAEKDEFYITATGEYLVMLNY